MVRIRTPQAAALRAALDAHGIESELASPDLVLAHGAATETVGRAIAAAGLIAYEIYQEHTDLEHAFFDLTTTRDGSRMMNDLIRSELRKQRSVRLPAIALTAAAAAGALTAIALITTAGHDGNPPLHRAASPSSSMRRTRSSPAPPS